MTTAPKLIPERVREAREAAGLTDEQFADLLGVTRQAVGHYETGQGSPRGEVLKRIIAVTGQPPSFFTTQRKRAGERFRVPNWRSLKRMQRPDRLRIGRRLEWAYDIVEYLETFINLPPVNVPSFDFDGTDNGIEDIADALRLFWGLGLSPIHDLAPILEYNGFIIVEEYVRCDDMDAVSRWQGGRPFILCAKENDSNPRRIFNLAHELGHIIIHSGIEVNSENIDRIEKQANRFAGAFLMPRQSFAREVASTSIDYFMFLKERWRVAIAAMVYRCRELSILNQNQVEYLWKQMNARKIRKKEPLDAAFPLSAPTVLASGVTMLLSAGKRSAAEIVDAIALNAKDIESICGLPDGALGTKVVALRLRN
jgi:Zn-dependent peptidase ImmA (M78 family)/DNA-binding XRE family transcriptional regulator